jgi:hypothetical protein
MDIHFCQYYKGNGLPPSNRFCRICPFGSLACNALWDLVIALSVSNGGKPVPLPNTRAVLFPNPNNPDIVHLKINVRWGLPKEDFLHFIATGHAQMGRKNDRDNLKTSPSMTRQEPYVQAIMHLLGGEDIPEIIAVRNIQQTNKR